MSIFDSRTHRHISPSKKDQVDRSDRLPQWCYEVIHKQKPQPMGHPWDPQNAWLAWLTNGEFLAFAKHVVKNHPFCIPFCDNWHTIRKFQRMNRHPNGTNSICGHFFTWNFFPPSHRTINFKMFSKIKTTCRNNWKMKMCLFLAYILSPSSPKMFFLYILEPLLSPVSVTYVLCPCNSSITSSFHFISFHFTLIVFNSQLCKNILNQKNLLKKAYFKEDPKILNKSEKIYKEPNLYNTGRLWSDSVLGHIDDTLQFDLGKGQRKRPRGYCCEAIWEKGANLDVKWTSEDERCEHRHVTWHVAYLPPYS